MSLSYRNQSIDLLCKSSDWFFIWLGQWSLNTEICNNWSLNALYAVRWEQWFQRHWYANEKKNSSEINNRSGNEILITVILNFVPCFCITIIISFVLRFCIIVIINFVLCFCVILYHSPLFCTLFMRYFMPYAILWLLGCWNQKPAEMTYMMIYANLGCNFTKSFLSCKNGAKSRKPSHIFTTEYNLQKIQLIFHQWLNI